MAIFILLVAALIFFFETSAGKIPGQVGVPMTFLCFSFVMICLFSKQKYKKRELICSAELLPIVDEILDKLGFCATYITLVF